VIADDLKELLGHRLPGDHARQTLAHDMVAGAMAGVSAPAVLDLGCGNGDSVDLFRSLDATASWVGLDVDDSAEVLARTRTDAEFATFDVLELRPGIDGLTLILRRGLGGPSYFDRWWSLESPLNRVIGLFARVRRLDPASANAIKLLFCGQMPLRRGALGSHASPWRSAPAASSIASRDARPRFVQLANECTRPSWRRRATRTPASRRRRA